MAIYLNYLELLFTKMINIMFLSVLDTLKVANYTNCRNIYSFPLLLPLNASLSVNWLQQSINCEYCTKLWFSADMTLLSGWLQHYFPKRTWQTHVGWLILFTRGSKNPWSLKAQRDLLGKLIRLSISPLAVYLLTPTCLFHSVVTPFSLC